MVQMEKIEMSKYWLPTVAVGTGFCLLIFCSIFYALTRPCAVGKCQEIFQAKQLAQRSENILAQPSSTKEIIVARQQLEESIETLQSIPKWSHHYFEAENLIEAYQGKTESLQDLVTALQISAQAVALAENTPFLVSQWQEIQQLWQEAIAALEKLPADSPFYSLARTKIYQYQENLANTNKELETEAQATKNLQAAKEAIEIARKSENNAQSFSDWQLVYATWTTAVKRLQQIPPQTTVYQEAELLLTSLKPELKLAEKRLELEEFANNQYREATRIAKLAKQAESNKKWTEAVSHWRNTLNYLQQVPENSFQYRQAKPLIDPYNYALKQAQFQLHVALRLQQARKDLETTCSGNSIICNYTINNDAIKVHLTPDYMEQVQQIALQAKAQKNLKVQVNVLEHIFSLEQALKSITKNAGIRVEIYNSDDVLVLTYAPSNESINYPH
ncbi:MAG: hypothetical protein AB4038_10890 [Prochloraceae cyanobacterium]